MPYHQALDTSHFWMPFTANRQLKAKPRLLVEAQGMYYSNDDGRKIECLAVKIRHSNLINPNKS